MKERSMRPFYLIPLIALLSSCSSFQPSEIDKAVALEFACSAGTIAIKAATQLVKDGKISGGSLERVKEAQALLKSTCDDPGDDLDASLRDIRQATDVIEQGWH
jgi:hypothetical protein